MRKFDRSILQFSRSILYEDNHYLVINKRAGDIVQDDKTGDTTLLAHAAAFLVTRDKKPGKAYVGLPHRLDRPTSGVLVLAKTSKGLIRMNELFKKGEVEKVYWAVVAGKHFQKDIKEEFHYLFRDRKKNKSFAYTQPAPGRKEVRLSWRSLMSGERATLIEVQLITGRHHQIRAQLASRNMVIVGDRKYGSKATFSCKDIGLHCRRLSFIHPVKRTAVTVTASLPAKSEIWKPFLEYGGYIPI